MSVRNLLHNVPLPAGQVVGLIASAFLDSLWTARMPGSRKAHRAAGSALVLAGCALTGWALAERRRHESEGFDLDRPQTLVTTGPYALSRHPMYVGWWLIHLGFGVIRGSTWVLMTAPTAALLEHRAVLTEEGQLTDAFGRQHTRYADLVPRYLPLRIRLPQS